MYEEKYTYSGGEEELFRRIGKEAAKEALAKRWQEADRFKDVDVKAWIHFVYEVSRVSEVFRLKLKPRLSSPSS